jgi:hypothetical protein
MILAAPIRVEIFPAAYHGKQLSTEFTIVIPEAKYILKDSFIVTLATNNNNKQCCTT